MENFPPSRSAPFPLAPAISERTRRALAAAVHRRDSTLVELQTAISVCVRSLREQGMSAGGVIITMKAFVRHTIEIAPPPGLVPSSESADALMDRIVTWCIDEYFRGAPLS